MAKGVTSAFIVGTYKRHSMFGVPRVGNGVHMRCVFWRKGMETLPLCFAVNGWKSYRMIKEDACTIAGEGFAYTV